MRQALALLVLFWLADPAIARRKARPRPAPPMDDIRQCADGRHCYGVCDGDGACLVIPLPQPRPFEAAWQDRTGGWH